MSKVKLSIEKFIIVCIGFVIFILNDIVIISGYIAPLIFIYYGLWQTAIISFIIYLYATQRKIPSIFVFIDSIFSLSESDFNTECFQCRTNKIRFCAILSAVVSRVVLLFYIKFVMTYLITNGYEQAPLATCTALLACSVPAEIYIPFSHTHDIYSKTALASAIIFGSIYIFTNHITVYQDAMNIILVLIPFAIFLGLLCTIAVIYSHHPNLYLHGNNLYKTSENVYKSLSVIIILGTVGFTILSLLNIINTYIH